MCEPLKRDEADNSYDEYDYEFDFTPAPEPVQEKEVSEEEIEQLLRMIFGVPTP